MDNRIKRVAVLGASVPTASTTISGSEDALGQRRRPGPTEGVAELGIVPSRVGRPGCSGADSNGGPWRVPGDLGFPDGELAPDEHV